MRYKHERKRNFSSILSQFVKPNKQSLHELGEKTGIHPRTIRAHIEGRNNATYELQCEYMDALGAEFVTALFEDWGYRAVALEGKPEDGCYRAITAATAEFTHTSAKAQEDGFVDHQEIRVLVRMARSLKAKLSRFVAVRRVQTQ